LNRWPYLNLRLQGDYSQLTNEQKSFLVTQGGDLCVFFLGYLREIYKSIDEEIGRGILTLFGNVQGQA